MEFFYVCVYVCVHGGYMRMLQHVCGGQKTTHREMVLFFHYVGSGHWTQSLCLVESSFACWAILPAPITIFLFFFRRRGGKYAVGSACIGGGQGIAVIIQNTAWRDHKHRAHPYLARPHRTVARWPSGQHHCDGDCIWPSLDEAKCIRFCPLYNCLTWCVRLKTQPLKALEEMVSLRIASTVCLTQYNYKLNKCCLNSGWSFLDVF